MPGFDSDVLIKGYRVYYRIAHASPNESQNLTLTNSSWLSVELSGLKKFTLYSIQLSILTQKGEEGLSVSVFASTDEDGEYYSIIVLHVNPYFAGIGI